MFLENLINVLRSLLKIFITTIRIQLRNSLIFLPRNSRVFRKMKKNRQIQSRKSEIKISWQKKRDIITYLLLFVVGAKINQDRLSIKTKFLPKTNPWHSKILVLDRKKKDNNENKFTKLRLKMTGKDI